MLHIVAAVVKFGMMSAFRLSNVRHLAALHVSFRIAKRKLDPPARVRFSAIAHSIPRTHASVHLGFSLPVPV